MRLAQLTMGYLRSILTEYWEHRKIKPNEMASRDRMIVQAIADFLRR